MGLDCVQISLWHLVSRNANIWRVYPKLLTNFLDGRSDAFCTRTMNLYQCDLKIWNTQRFVRFRWVFQSSFGCINTIRHNHKVQSWEANQWRWDAERLRGLAMEVYFKKSITSMLPYTGAWVLYCTTSQDNQNAPWNPLETHFDQCLMSRFWGWEHHWRKPRWTNTETCHCFFCRSHKFASQALWTLCVFSWG